MRLTSFNISTWRSQENIEIWNSEESLGKRYTFKGHLIIDRNWSCEHEWDFPSREDSVRSRKSLSVNFGELQHLKKAKLMTRQWRNVLIFSLLLSPTPSPPLPCSVLGVGCLLLLTVLPGLPCLWLLGGSANGKHWWEFGSRKRKRSRDLFPTPSLFPHHLDVVLVRLWFFITTPLRYPIFQGSQHSLGLCNSIPSSCPFKHRGSNDFLLTHPIPTCPPSPSQTCKESSH